MTDEFEGKETVTLLELGRIFRIGRNSLYELAARDELPVPVIKTGRTYRFSKRAIDELLTRQHAKESSEDE